MSVTASVVGATFDTRREPRGLEMKWTWVVVLFATAAQADVPTDDEALVYAGRFEGAAAGSVVSVSLYDAQTAGTGTALCPPVQARVQGTAFEASLSGACARATRSSAAAFVEVTVNGIALPRVRMRAQPYALESKRVVFSYMGKRTTAQGLYCNPTASTTGSFSAQAGAVTGYRAAKLLCEQSCTSPTAHQCSNHEALTSHIIGMTVPAGWVIGAYDPPATSAVHRDCSGFRSTAGDNYGQTWGGSTGQFEYSACGNSAPILCCD
jgi:hypothetical protein